MASGTAAWSTGLALIVGMAGLPCLAQDKANKEDEFWEVRQRQEAGAAAQIVLARNPFSAAILRNEGLRFKVWTEPEFLSDTAPALNEDWLDAIRDGTPMPDVRAKAKDEIRKDQMAALRLWSQAVIIANNTPEDAFAKSAQENAYVTFGHLWNDPGKYRGKVIPIKGRLKRLRKYEATREAQKEGVKFVYEGWVFGPTRGSHPYCIVFPVLPDGLQEAEEMNRAVSFNGYFIKKLKYPAADKSMYLETPLLIGPTVTLTKEAVAPLAESSIPMTVVVWVVVLLIVVSVGLGLLSWHFRRGDLALKKRLADMQASRAMALQDHDCDHDDCAQAEAKPQPPQGFPDEPPQTGVR
jgi:hypothetical protein